MFLQVLRWFTSLGWLAPAYVFSGPFLMLTSGGFPHSEIPGSKLNSSSPRLIAGIHVLLRRLAPRHPPYALSSLTIKSAQHTDEQFISISVSQFISAEPTKCPY